MATTKKPSPQPAAAVPADDKPKTKKQLEKELEEQLFAPSTSENAKAVLKELMAAFPNARCLGIASKVVSDSKPLPCGSHTLDWMIGTRGIMPAKIYEFWGPPSCGKTLEADCWIREVQQNGIGGIKEKNVAVYADIERSADEATTLAWKAQQGVDVTSLIYIRETAEKTMDMLHRCAQMENVGIIVVDSVPSLVLEDMLTGKEANREMEKDRYKSLSNLMPKFLGKFNIVTKGAALVCINQVRANIGGGRYDDEYDTPGGWALKHFAHVRIRFDGIKMFQDLVYGKTKEQLIIGIRMFVKSVKNKLGSPGKIGQIDFYYKTGVDHATELYQLGRKHFIFQVKGAWIYYDPKQKQGGVPVEPLGAQGEAGFVAKLRERPDMMGWLREEILAKRTAVIEIPTEELDPET